MFKTFGFWISALGFAIVWFFGKTLSIDNFLGVVLGCWITNIAYAVGRHLGDD